MESRSYRFFKYQFPVILWAVIILTVSSIPKIGVITQEWTRYDKVLHFAEYGVLGYLLTRAFFYQNNYSFIRKYALILSVIIGIVFAGFDEMHQKFIPGRFDSIWDFFADISGIILVQFLYVKSIFKARDNKT